jgi:hypothetical protein
MVTAIRLNNGLGQKGIVKAIFAQSHKQMPNRRGDTMDRLDHIVMGKTTSEQRP